LRSGLGLRASALRGIGRSWPSPPGAFFDLQVGEPRGSGAAGRTRSRPRSRAGCGSDDLGKSVDAGAACLRASWKSSVADALRGMSVCQGQGGGASAAGTMPDCSATGRLVAPTITPPLSSKLLVRDSTTVPTNQIVSRRVLGCSNGENDRARRCYVDSRRSLFLRSRIAAHSQVGCSGVTA